MLFGICSAFSWGNFGNLFYDNGREAYLPQLILESKILFKDIFGMYNPLSYQINAVLYAIFCKSFNVLYTAGTINAFLIVVGLYLTARIFINQFYSFVYCILIMSVYIYSSTTCTNYIFPYAYAFPYALCGFVYFVLFSLLYLKFDNKKYLLPASFSLGFSLANKPEFLLCILPFIGMLIIRKETFKTIFLNFAVFVTPLILSWGILFLQGFSLVDLQNYMEFIHKFFETEEQQIYQKNSTYPWSLDNIKSAFINFIYTTLYLTASVLYFKLYSGKLKTFIAIILLPVMVITTVLCTKSLIMYNPFSWVLFLVLAILCLNFRHPKTKTSKIFILLSVFAICSCIRVNCLLLGLGYSLYLSLLPLLICWVWFIGTEKNFVEKHKLKKYLSIAIIFFSVCNTYILFNAKYRIYGHLKTDKGTISTVKSHTEVMQKTIDWINNNTKTNDRVVMLPEGPMINFITGRKTDNMYYHLIPNHIKALDEENIVNDFLQNKPEYFLINNMIYNLYGKDYICEDFGFKICRFIKRNYRLIEKYESGGKANDYIFIEIYKLKKDGN